MDGVELIEAWSSCNGRRPNVKLESDRWLSGIPRRLRVAKPREEPAAPARSDGRRQLLIYLDPELIKELKRTALDEDRPAYEIADVAIREWLRTWKREKRT